jgi:hypothetical protein
MISHIKKKLEGTPSYAEVIGQWRLQRKVQLTDQKWPQIMKNIIHELSCPLYGLTQVETGPLGPIKSMEQWRMNELNALGIHFSITPSIEHISPDQKKSCYQGCIMTGIQTKSEAITGLFNWQMYHNVIMIDDRKAHLESLKNFFSKKNIFFWGFQWIVPLIQSNPSLDQKAKKQKQSLVDTLKWLD